jgi:hypothetical protein
MLMCDIAVIYFSQGDFFHIFQKIYDPVSKEPLKSIGQASSIISQKMASVGYGGSEIPFTCTNNFANPVY